jgi:hypothetical protein
MLPPGQIGRFATREATHDTPPVSGFVELQQFSKRVVPAPVGRARHLPFDPGMGMTSWSAAVSPAILSRGATLSVAATASWHGWFSLLSIIRLPEECRPERSELVSEFSNRSSPTGYPTRMPRNPGHVHTARHGTGRGRESPQFPAGRGFGNRWGPPTGTHTGPGTHEPRNPTCGGHLFRCAWVGLELICTDEKGWKTGLGQG